MATSVKTKFAGLLRGLLRRLDDRAPVAASPIAPTPEPSPAPVSSRPATVEKISPPPARPVTPDGIELPLAAVIAALPLELRAKLMAPPSAGLTICLPAETVMAQLAFGAVKISFGELRQLAPGIFANSGGEHDSRPINLPLQEILTRLNPALLARREGQKMEVSEEIAGPFGGRGQGITFTTQTLKGTPVPPAPAAPTPAPTPIRPAVVPPTPPVAFTPPPRAPMPTVPLTCPPRQTAPTNFTPAPPTKLASNGNGNLNGHSNGNGNGNSNGSNNGNSPVPPPLGVKFTAVPVPPPTPPTPAPAHAAQEVSAAPAAGPMLFVPLGALAETWPEELRNEIVRSNLAGVNVPLALAAVEPGLKRGRVTMAWKQLRSLAKPGSAPSPHDALELDLSLKVLAPIFFEAQKNLPRPARKVSVSAEIPNLFFGFPQPAAEPVSAPAPAPAAAPNGKVLDTNFYGQATESETELRAKETPATDFLSRQAHPKEVVAHAVKLPGVAGAVVALPDGLRVASEVPTDLNADTLAAFLPQIFDRVNQSTRELRMGPLNNLSFTVGAVPWKIFRVSSVYFAAFGRAGEALPTAQLAQLATELDRKKSK